MRRQDSNARRGRTTACVVGLAMLLLTGTRSVLAEPAPSPVPDVHPLDARVHVALAQLALTRRDVDGALSEARRAVALGPRHPTVQSGAVRVAAEAWLHSGRVDALATALDLEDLRASWQPSVRCPGAVVAALRSREDSVLGDMIEACSDSPSRLRVAHGWLAVSLPDLAPVLEETLGRASESE